MITPPLQDQSGADSLVASVAGLVFTGGEDVGPAQYGALPHPRLGRVSDERDSWELALIKSAARARKPVLAICRGIQVLNVALGGTLIQDLPSERPGPINHDPDRPRTLRSHDVEVREHSRTAGALGAARLSVNSVHHQAIDRIADGLMMVGTAPDGTIEAVEAVSDSDWWCVGVQWHPEDLADSPELWERSLFAAFADEVRRSSSHLHARAVAHT